MSHEALLPLRREAAVRRQHPPDDRVAAERVARPLPVSVPQLSAAEKPPRRAREDAPDRSRVRDIEPDDGVRLVDHEHAELPVVVAVDYPSLRRRRERGAHALLQELRRCFHPVRVVVERIELHVRNAELGGECPRHGRLPRA